MADSSHTLLVLHLNQLFEELQIPIAIESPWELTPLLILATLESMLRKRLPVTQTLRQSRDLGAKTKTMEILLLCLADYVAGAGSDVRDVDPKRLALGEWDEVVFVGGVLCWLGRDRGYLTDAAVQLPFLSGSDASTATKPENTSSPGDHAYDSDPPSPSPFRSSTRSTLTSRENSALFTNSSTRQADSDTAVLSILPQIPTRVSLPTDVDLPEPKFLSELLPKSRTRANISSTASIRSKQSTPRCIHEVEEPFVIRSRARPAKADHLAPELDTDPDSSISSECPSGIFHPPKNTPVRHTGWIEPVDIDEELRSFETTHNASVLSSVARTTTPRATARVGQSPATRTPVVGAPQRLVTRHNSPTQHALTLLNERAKLMQDLAGLKSPVTR